MAYGIPGTAKKLLFIACICLAIKITAGLGAEAKTEDFFYDLAQKDTVCTEILTAELGTRTGETNIFPLFALFNESHLLSSAEEAISLSFDEPENESEHEIVLDSPSPILPKKDVIETEIKPDSSYLNINDIYVKNKTDYSIDISSLFNEPLNISLDPQKPQILIIHTHGSEAYTPDGEDIYTESDPSRTEDTNYNVVRVGDELEKAFKERGISVIHDRTLYDYPSYTGSYERSLEAINKHIAENPEIKIVIDLHRDALEDKDGNIYKTTADINGVKSSQVMMVIGSDFSGLEHPDWRQNLKLALHLQAAMNEKYPSLTRPISISQYRYNQHATTGSFILEVGCNGNTLKESLNAITFFADAASDVLLSLSTKT